MCARFVYITEEPYTGLWLWTHIILRNIRAHTKNKYNVISIQFLFSMLIKITEFFFVLFYIYIYISFVPSLFSVHMTDDKMNSLFIEQKKIAQKKREESEKKEQKNCYFLWFCSVPNYSHHGFVLRELTHSHTTGQPHTRSYDHHPLILYTPCWNWNCSTINMNAYIK
jgi:hypothetical protein